MTGTLRDHQVHDSRLQGRLVPVAAVTRADRDQMFAVMKRHYEQVCRNDFEADLAEKQWVILLHEPAHGTVRGFSTQMLLDVTVDDQPIRALFSGDTIVDRAHWAQNPLAQIWGRFALSLMEADDAIPLYWFLITKGYKTYRFLPVFFHEFYPCYDARTPAWAARVITALASHKFPGTYDATAGIVRADDASCRLRSDVAQLTSRRLRDPHIRFFAERNPGHRHGDELCCVAPLTRENFTPAAYRVIGAEESPLTSTLDISS